jgi:REP element-mobilizing transposase RayT
LDSGRDPQFVTFRLEDSLPTEVFAQWKLELAQLPEGEAKKAMTRRIEAYLDEGHGSRLLQNPVAAQVVQDALVFAHERKCDMHAWSVLHNHVHLCMTPHPGQTVGTVIGPLKSFTAMVIHRSLGMAGGRLWQPEYFDTAIRDSRHYDKVVEYIEWNPVKAGLCSDPTKWPYSTASLHVQKLIAEATGRRGSAAKNE